MKVYIKNRKRKEGQFQFYMHQFVESAIINGIKPKNDLLFDVAFWLNSLKVRLVHLRNNKEKRRTSNSIPDVNGSSFLRKLAKLLYPLLNKKTKKKAIIVASTGNTFFRNSFPFFYHYEIIPILWDVWPSTWESLYKDLIYFDCKIVFVTVEAVGRKISSDLNIPVYWIPEGIDLNDYKKGESLLDRPIEIYELGRQKKEYHSVLENLFQLGIIKKYCKNTYSESGTLQKLAFETTSELIEGLAKTKILVSFPLIDTHPDKAGGLETLTQRYWEAMLSRCLMVGRAPEELIKFIGYDPVINIDWHKPGEQLECLLNHISDYQELVDKNYKVALEKASWNARIITLIEVLKRENYDL